MMKEPSNPTSAAAETPTAPGRDARTSEPSGLSETPGTPGDREPASETGETPPDGGMPRQPANPGNNGAGAIPEKPEKPANPPAPEGIHANGQADAAAEPAAQRRGDNPPPEGEPAALPEAIRLKLLTAEIRSVGAELGLLDTEAALRLMPPEAVTVNAQGEVAGVREALTALQQSKGYLFARAARGAWAQRMGDSAPRLTGVEEAFYRKNPALRK